MKLKNVLLVVENIERSKKFYEQLFGLKIVMDFGENVILTEGLVLQERQLWEKFINKSVVYDGGDAELYFEENDLDAFIEKLHTSDLKIEYVHEMVVHDWGQRVLRMYDPDHHVIEVAESLEFTARRFLNLGWSPQAVADKTQLPLSVIKEML